MRNVVMMNLAYYVPVKLYSSHLLLLAIILVALAWRRVANVLVLNRPAQAAVYRPHFVGRKARAWALAVKVLVIVGILLPKFQEGLAAERHYGASALKTAVWGTYDVEPSPSTAKPCHRLSPTSGGGRTSSSTAGRSACG